MLAQPRHYTGCVRYQHVDDMAALLPLVGCLRLEACFFEQCETGSRQFMDAVLDMLQTDRLQKFGPALKYSHPQEIRIAAFEAMSYAHIVELAVRVRPGRS